LQFWCSFSLITRGIVKHSDLRMVLVFYLRSLSVQLDVKRSNLDGGKYLAGIEIKLDYNNSLQVLSDYLSSDSAVECYWWDCMCPQSNVQKRNVEPNH